MVALAKHPDVAKYDLSSLTAVGSGAAPLSRDIAKMVEERVNRGRGPKEAINLKQGWGMTEYVIFLLIMRCHLVQITNGFGGQERRARSWASIQMT